MLYWYFPTHGTAITIGLLGINGIMVVAFLASIGAAIRRTLETHRKMMAAIARGMRQKKEVGVAGSALPSALRR